MGRCCTMKSMDINVFARENSTLLILLFGKTNKYIKTRSKLMNSTNSTAREKQQILIMIIYILKLLYPTTFNKVIPYIFVLLFQKSFISTQVRNNKNRVE